MATPNAVACPRHRRLDDSHQRGFTLVELLVVIAIIGILVAILLPAVQAARESARRTQCMNNLKQLALALVNYESSHRTFPPGGQWPESVNPKIYNFTADIAPNWTILILPYIEEQSLYESFELDVSIAAPENRLARGTRIATMECPSDTGHDRFYDGSSANPAHGDNWARGNYAANGANAALGADSRWDFSFGGAGDSDTDRGAWQDPFRRGVMGANQKSQIRQITDGTSKTILLSEVRVGLSAKDQRGTWAKSGLPSTLYWHAWHQGSTGRANGPNDCTINSDDIPRCVEVAFDLGSIQALIDECMPCKLSVGTEGQVGTRSRHVGGVYSAFVDGSIHWIGDDIETRETCCSVWDRLVLSKDGFPVSYE